MGYTPQAQCACVHHNALTCIAMQHNMSRFNASIVFAGRSTQRVGRCTCRCHSDATTGQPITEQAWRDARKQKEAEAALASGQKNFPVISAAAGIAHPKCKPGRKARRP